MLIYLQESSKASAIAELKFIPADIADDYSVLHLQLLEC